MISPTGKGLRISDPWGEGHFGAVRDQGSRVHRGADFICTPGQSVRAPMSGIVDRITSPHVGSRWLGMVIVAGAGLLAKVFYLQPRSGLVGRWVEQGELIGLAEDVGMEWPGITPHIHLGLVGLNNEHFDPELLIRA